MKVSEYRVLTKMLKNFFLIKGEKFVDLNLDDFVEEQNSISLKEKYLHIINLYEKKFQNIFDNNAVAMLAKYVEFIFKYEEEEIYVQRLSQNTLAYNICKNILCAMYPDLDIDLKLLRGDFNYLDISEAFSEVNINGDKENFIYVNSTINEKVKDLFFVLEVLKYNNKNTDSFMDVVCNTPVSEKLRGMLKLHFKDDSDVELFMSMLLFMSGRSYKNSNIRLAQYTNDFNYHGTFNSFWFLGLVEKMLEPFRGTDNTVKDALDPYTESFWNNVFKIKMKKGESPSMEELLRIKNKFNITIDPKKNIVQKMLEKCRDAK